jgi:hypothetical protein
MQHTVYEVVLIAAFVILKVAFRRQKKLANRTTYEGRVDDDERVYCGSLGTFDQAKRKAGSVVVATACENWAGLGWATRTPGG